MCVFFVFFFKQKTAYGMRISDWSSDVCSSDLRLARLAEADLVDGDHAKARACESGDRRLPGCRAEVLAVQQQHRAPVGLGGGGDVHVRHRQLLLLRVEFEALDRVRVGEDFELRAVDRRFLGGGGGGGKREGEEGGRE